MTSTGSALFIITDRRYKTVTYNWTITNLGFLDPEESDGVVYSDPFETDRNVRWQVALKKRDHYFYNYRRTSKTLYFGLKFLGCSVLGPFYSMDVKLECRTTNNNAIVLHPEHLLFNSKSIESYKPTHMKLDEVFNLIAKDGQTLMVTYCITTKPTEGFTIPRDHLLLPNMDLERKNRELTNVILVASNGSSLKAHREILTTHSPVFAAMFHTDMVENKQNRVKIDDVSFEVLSQLLTFVYTGKVKIDPESAVGFVDMLAAADKYDLKRLKAACEHALFKQIDVSKSIDTLLMADKYNAQQLKMHTLQFIKSNVHNVINTGDWKTLIEKHPHLLLEVNQAIAKE